MIPQSDVAAAARDYCKTWPQDTYHPNDLAMFYEKGANWYRDRVMEMASEGFDDFYRSRESGPRLSYDEVWQVATVSAFRDREELHENAREMKKDLEWALKARQSLRFTREYSKDDQHADEIRTRWGLE